MSGNRAGIGGNFPPEPIEPEDPDLARIKWLSSLVPEDLLRCEVEDIAPLLSLQFAPLANRSAELFDAAAAWLAEHSDPKTKKLTVGSDEELNITSELIRQLGDHAGKTGEVEVARVKVKTKPFRLCQAIDSWFKNLTEPAAALIAEMDRAQKVYMAAKIAREEEARRAAEQLARAEAARVAREVQERQEKARRELEEAMAAARDDGSDAAIEAALEAEELAQLVDAQAQADLAAAQVESERAARAARASVPSMTRTHSVIGITTSASQTYAWELEDMAKLVAAVAAGKLPINFLMVNDKIINLEVRSKTRPLRQAPGLRIFPDVKMNRRGG